MRKLLTAALALVAVAQLPGPAAAQSLDPMRGEVRSLADAFAVRVKVRNPYQHTIGIEMRAYDTRFRPVLHRASAKRFPIAAGETRTVTVAVPFGERMQRRVRICAESVPFRPKKNATRVRTRICGKFLARRF